MSTDYITSKDIPYACVFDGRLEKFGVYEHIVEGKSSEISRCLTDGRDYLWISASDDGLLRCITGYNFNVPSRILTAIAETFDAEIFSEHDPQFWGFDTQEEWDACQGAMAKEAEESFYVEVLKYVRGESADITPGTIGMRKAEIAKRLVEEDPELLLATNKDNLLNAIDERDEVNVVKVTLNATDVAFVRMLTADDGDLPSA